MADLNFINLNDIADLFGSKTLDDAAFIQMELLGAQIEKPIEVEQVSFSFGALGNFHLQLFNSPDDQDPDGLAGTLIQPKADGAWLKYQVKSGLKASAAGELSQLGFDFAGEKSLIFNTYRKHSDRSQSIGKSVLKDLQPFLFAAQRGHLEKLQPGEVLSVHLPGTLSLALSLTWADVFTGNLSAFSRLLSGNEVFNVEVGASLKAGFTVRIQDDFSLVIQRTDADAYEVYLKKALTKRTGGSLTAAIGVEFSKPEAVVQVLVPVAEGLVSNLKGKIKPILEKKPLDKLSAAEGLIVQELNQRLGLEGEAKTVADLEKALLDKLGGLIKEVATTKVKVNFSYEYQRIESTSALLQATFSGQALLNYHRDLIRFRLDQLLSDIQNQSAAGVQLKEYLHEKTVERKQAWGLTLGIGKWKASSQNLKTVKEVDRTVKKGDVFERMVAFEGIRFFEDQLFNDKVSWMVDFDAEMTHFTANTPFANEFRYGLSLTYQWQEAQLGESAMERQKLQTIVDHAVMWKAIPQEAFDPVLKQLQTALVQGKASDIKASIHLNIQPDVLLLLLADMGSPHLASQQMNTQLMAQALGASMAYLSQFAARNNVKTRAKQYGPLWLSFLQQDEPDTSRQLRAEQARKHLKNADTQLAEEEGKAAGNSSTLWYANLATENGSAKLDWHSFHSGVSLLQAGITQGRIYRDIIPKAFESMQKFWRKSLYVRALGYYLLDLTERKFLLSGIDSTLTINYQVNGEEKVLNMTGKLA
jgi:hypothetical protein